MAQNDYKPYPAKEGRARVTIAEANSYEYYVRNADNALKALMKAEKLQQKHIKETSRQKKELQALEQKIKTASKQVKIHPTNRNLEKAKALAEQYKKLDEQNSYDSYTVSEDIDYDTRVSFHKYIDAEQGLEMNEMRLKDKYYPDLQHRLDDVSHDKALPPSIRDEAKKLFNQVKAIHTQYVHDVALYHAAPDDLGHIKPSHTKGHTSAGKKPSHSH